ncbi:hypothetical protein ASPCADRAFT_2166 [Aspergillus carbonarius ITEM 5010]|uniref:Aminoglycoside phosphotransferase domain-containing protein n=1 Tax=Aspergillus carbonarius (strain ITEM 5010) TaxID=602072 RepID=A0A1R3RW76_ASPC5|nr:hypothetical protein ASPCADRAFT_2166 [Aspergillus carbonarius ITEM 5010]
MPSRWFARSETEPGTTIPLQQYQWVILQTCNEHEFQTPSEDLRDSPEPSMTCTLLLCKRAGPDHPIQAYMRIYKQIPIAGTEAEPANKQDDTGFVPGGLITWLVWEVVPGIRLSDPCGAAAFWALDISERDAIREAFKESIMKLYRWGYYPLHGNGRNLVWDADTSTL